MKKILQRLLYYGLLSECLMVDSDEIEAVKLGIVLAGALKYSEDDFLLEELMILGLCEEFTLQVNIALVPSNEANKHRIELYRKTNGWGNFAVLQTLNIPNRKFEEEVLTRDIEENVAKGLVSRFIVYKIDVAKYLDRERIPTKLYNGISRIIKNCLLGVKEETNGQAKIEIKNRDLDNICNLYMARFLEFNEDITNYDVLIQIYLYADDIGNNAMKNFAAKLLDDKEVTKLVENAVKTGDTNQLLTAMKVCLYNDKIILHDKVFNRFLEDPIKNSFCTHYLLQAKSYAKEALKALKNVMKLEEHYALPLPEICLDAPYEKAMCYILKALQDYPLQGQEFIVAGLRSRRIEPRYDALLTVNTWIENGVKLESLKDDLIEALFELKDLEMIKENLLLLKNILKLKKDYSKYESPDINVAIPTYLIEYVSVKYDDLPNDVEYTYYYKTENEGIKIGDKVIVNRKDEATIATVVDIDFFERNEVPYPIEKTKDIIRVLTEEEKAKIENDKNHKEDSIYIYLVYTIMFEIIIKMYKKHQEPNKQLEKFFIKNDPYIDAETFKNDNPLFNEFKNFAYDSELFLEPNKDNYESLMIFEIYRFIDTSNEMSKFKDLCKDYLMEVSLNEWHVTFDRGVNYISTGITFVGEAEKELREGISYYRAGNFKEAIKHYELAGSLGNKDALTNLGYCYYYGRGTDIDYKKAYMFFEMAAKEGNITATYKLGDLAKKDKIYGGPKKAEEYYRKAYELAKYEKDLDYYPDICARMAEYYIGKDDDMALELNKEAIKGFMDRIALGDPFSEGPLEDAQNQRKRILNID